MDQVSNSILDSLRAKMASPEFQRPDMTLADYRVLDNDSALVLMGYDPMIGTPSPNDIAVVATRVFEGRVAPVTATVKVHADVGAISFVAARIPDTRPIADAQRMTVCGAAQFLDQKIGQIWEVEKSDEGVEYLRRVQQEDMTQILAARRQRMTQSGQPVRAYFGQNVSAGYNVLNPGDEVRVWARNSVRAGIVQDASDPSTVTLKGTDGRPYQVRREAVVAFDKPGPQTQSLLRDKLKEYYGEFWQPQYLEEIMKLLNV